MNKMIGICILASALFFAQENSSRSTKAEDLILDSYVKPTVEDTIGINDWHKYFLGISRCSVNRQGNMSLEFSSNGIWVTNLENNGKIIIDNRGDKPKWSPNGEKIVYAKRRLLEGQVHNGHQLYGKHELWICNSDGSDKTKISEDLSVDEYLWTANSKQIVFSYDSVPIEENSPIVLGVIDLDNHKITEIDAGSPYTDFCFSVSPNGDMIAYCKPLKWKLLSEWWVTDAELYIANIDGASRQQITQTDAVEISVKWLDNCSLIIEQMGRDPEDISFPQYIKVLLRQK